MSNITAREAFKERIAIAIMTAFFSRDVDDQVMNVTVADHLDLAEAVLQEVESSLRDGYGRANENNNLKA